MLPLFFFEIKCFKAINKNHFALPCNLVEQCTDGGQSVYIGIYKYIHLKIT